MNTTAPQPERIPRSIHLLRASFMSAAERINSCFPLNGRDLAYLTSLSTNLGSRGGVEHAMKIKTPYSLRKSPKEGVEL